MFSPLCTSGLYAMKLYFLDYSVENVKTTKVTSFLHVSAYEQFNLDIKRAIKRSCRRRATRVQETVMLMDLPQTD